MNKQKRKSNDLNEWVPEEKRNKKKTRNTSMNPYLIHIKDVSETLSKFTDISYGR